ncbi:hypothetical protein SAMN04490243_2008 [Robiginitalea myxolifaciens]|uniref:Uncharacterized protein n=1 Tax=Robiginitalea myxolifaciens TaxID=400055 RepID=A0A1I6H0L3_9FLAO|nr:hypothetical protein [Robiginitalea myxolifaciens]SFR48005.1 hypothetical protein SAMN04490243_2008 [Robiginitalea myxolifaciens]
MSYFYPRKEGNPKSSHTPAETGTLQDPFRHLYYLRKFRPDALAGFPDA